MKLHDLENNLAKEKEAKQCQLLIIREVYERSESFWKAEVYEQHSLRK